VNLRILVLGGYGLFGRHVCMGLRRMDLPASAINRTTTIEVWVAGRDAGQAQACVAKVLAMPCAMPQTWHALALDHQADPFAAQLAAMRIDLVIHSAGPFQAQRYHVAEAAIAAGAHYIDLADSRDFVSGICALDAAARTAKVTVLSGASSVPAISSAVVTELAIAFSQLDSIDVGISPGNRTERGLATVAAILSYVGAPIPNWRGGKWITAHGWQGLRRFNYPKPAGTRWLVDCDVPDLCLLPAKFPGVQSVRFGAGLEHPLMHFGLYALAWLRRFKLLGNLARLARPMRRASMWFEQYGSDVGVMHVQLRGKNLQGAPHHCRWTLLASAGAGPNVPATPAVAIAAALLMQKTLAPGARPCVAEISLAAIQAHWVDLPIVCRLAGDTESSAD
jgi:hypothetical protein